VVADILLDRRCGTSHAHVVTSERAHGDLHPIHTDIELLARRQREVASRSWSMLDQRHGREAVEVHGDSSWPIAGIGDVVVSRGPSGPAIGVWAADCAPIVLIGDAGTVVGVHAGWRGLAAGVVDVGVRAATAAGEDVVAAVLGPVIHQCCYEFSAGDLDLVAAGVHSSVADIVGMTATGALALDVPSAVRSALAANDVELDVVRPCTGCTARWFSHRARTDLGRHAVIGWTETVDD